jgi:hypothetical protein
LNSLCFIRSEFVWKSILSSIWYANLSSKKFVDVSACSTHLPNIPILKHVSCSTGTGWLFVHIVHCATKCAYCILRSLWRLHLVWCFTGIPQSFSSSLAGSVMTKSN